ncbi:urea transporter [Bacillus wudalianchiensis]|uniref:Urea transporter n=1 Tax=Pseudobacillus wudalianchiensis TaxID=1743143 RepID=A0A1B9B7C3_9BACI|nr:urea transporter [Bacillus wudalianchiensis]
MSLYNKAKASILEEQILRNWKGRIIVQNTNHTRWAEGKLVSFLIATLKGISQVMLIENAVTGLIILLAITTFSYSLGIIALLSAFIGTIVGVIGGANKESINQGLFGYNSVLTGLALTLFLTGPYHWIIALVGAALAALLTATMMHVMKNTGIPVLTFPFITVTWFTILASYRLEAFRLTSRFVPQDLSNWQLDIAGKINWLEGAFDGIGQIFFIEGILSGILLFIAVFVAGWKLGLYAVLGNVVALLTSYLLGGEHTLIYRGLYGYNAILAIIAVSATFNTDHRRFGLLSGIFAACLTVPFAASIATWLLPYGLPALTMPFVLSTWLFLGAKKVLPNL